MRPPFFRPCDLLGAARRSRIKVASGVFTATGPLNELRNPVLPLQDEPRSVKGVGCYRDGIPTIIEKLPAACIKSLKYLMVLGYTILMGNCIAFRDVKSHLP